MNALLTPGDPQDGGPVWRRPYSRAGRIRLAPCPSADGGWTLDLRRQPAGFGLGPRTRTLGGEFRPRHHPVDGWLIARSGGYFQPRRRARGAASPQGGNPGHSPWRHWEVSLRRQASAIGSTPLPLGAGRALYSGSWVRDSRGPPRHPVCRRLVATPSRRVGVASGSHPYLHASEKPGDPRFRQGSTQASLRR